MVERETPIINEPLFQNSDTFHIKRRLKVGDLYRSWSSKTDVIN